MNSLKLLAKYNQLIYNKDIVQAVPAIWSDSYLHDKANKLSNRYNDNLRSWIEFVANLDADNLAILIDYLGGGNDK